VDFEGLANFADLEFLDVVVDDSFGASRIAII
jgi:hypothetical protein